MQLRFQGNMTPRNIRIGFFTCFCLVVPLGVGIFLNEIWCWLYYTENELAPSLYTNLTGHMIMGSIAFVGVCIVGVFVAELSSHGLIKLLYGRQEALIRAKIEALKATGQKLFTLTTAPLTIDDQKFLGRARRIIKRVIWGIGSFFFFVAVAFAVFSEWAMSVTAIAMGGMGCVLANLIAGYVDKSWREIDRKGEKLIVKGFITDKWGAHGEVYLEVSEHLFRVDGKIFDTYALGDGIEIEFVQLGFFNSIIRHKKVSEGIKT